MNNEQILADIAEHLDISPSDFKRAQDRYLAIQNCLENGTYASGTVPEIYLQGSFRLGTVVRPFRNDADGEFDIDQVCELASPVATPRPGRLKHDIGDQLKSDANYLRMLDDEGRRCWTLLYASERGRPGFHVDVLPAVPSVGFHDGQIDITEKDGMSYGWTISNPKGYYAWFKARNVFSDSFVSTERLRLFETNRDIYETPDDVPLQLARSALQRAIQLMKRHRDVYLSGSEHKPISIVITTICAHLYLSGSSLSEVISRFVEYVIERHTKVLRDGVVPFDGILDFNGSEWSIPNPVDAGKPPDRIENFADKWNLDWRLSATFFEWVYQLERNIKSFSVSANSDDLKLRTKKFGADERYLRILRRAFQSRIEQGGDATDSLLKLIHLGIDGELDWRSVENAAQSNYERIAGAGSTPSISEDTAKVNYYQVYRHQGQSLVGNAKADVEDILRRRQDDSDFVMCCNILLNRVTRDMIRDCIRRRSILDVLQWPIVRLIDRELLVPPMPQVGTNS